MRCVRPDSVFNKNVVLLLIPWKPIKPKNIKYTVCCASLLWNKAFVSIVTLNRRPWEMYGTTREGSESLSPLCQHKPLKFRRSSSAVLAGNKWKHLVRRGRESNGCYCEPQALNMSEQRRNSSPSFTYAPQVHASKQRHAKGPTRRLTSFRPLGFQRNKDICVWQVILHTALPAAGVVLCAFTLDKWFALFMVLSFDRLKADSVYGMMYWLSIGNAQPYVMDITCWRDGLQTSKTCLS